MRRVNPDLQEVRDVLRELDEAVACWKRLSRDSVERRAFLVSLLFGKRIGRRVGPP